MLLEMPRFGSLSLDLDLIWHGRSKKVSGDKKRHTSSGQWTDPARDKRAGRTADQHIATQRLGEIGSNCEETQKTCLKEPGGHHQPSCLAPLRLTHPESRHAHSSSNMATHSLTAHHTRRWCPAHADQLATCLGEI
ncbi:hypothetical protein ElyMa_003101200 [Elysia marginata]|uniref:Uncharacterized protein n=1 Tax=Elysia marginata TaxID=1093978 RepID=A0AAV4INN1_9GAST|nr:hypothetical protein ElyMa_003101200 [Elysia marginata]